MANKEMWPEIPPAPIHTPEYGRLGKNWDEISFKIHVNPLNVGP